MERKKITFTVTNDLSYDQRMQKICKALADDGYSVTLIGRRLPHSQPFALSNVKTKRIYCFLKKGFGFYLEYNVRLFFQLLFFENPSIFSAVDLDTIIPCTLAAKLKRKKLVFDAHEYFTEVPEVVHRPKVQKVWQFIENHFVHHANLCYTVGPALSSIFETKHNKPFGIIRNVPYFDPHYIENKNIDEKFILYQGALNKARGIEHMILAMKKIPLRFHIVGEGDLGDTLKKMVVEEGLENKVFFLGYMSPSQLKSYSQTAYMGLNVSEPMGLSYYYSLNNKFFDYVQAGLPALTNKFPEYETLIREYEVGILADSNPDDLAQKVNMLLDNSALYNKLKSNCEKARLEWNWENEKIKLLELYATLT